MRHLPLAALALLLPSFAPAQTPNTPTPHTFLRVTLAPSASPTPVSGRLLVFLKEGHGDHEVSLEEFRPADTWVVATDVHNLAPGSSVEVDTAALAYPAPFRTAPAADWEAQAVLDTDGTYNYAGRSPSNLVGPVLELPGFNPATSPEPTLTLTTHPAPESHTGPASEKALAAASAALVPIDLPNPRLTSFWGRPTSIRAWVVLPPGYATHPHDRYPTAYWAAGFGGTLGYARTEGAILYQRMLAGTMPPMIWVMLDESLPEGTHEFADSVNNGPWGTALTRDFIPALEQRFRMDARPSGRFLNGHSSGGWATLQLQVNFPDVFGGTWSTSPDPSDFHNFTGPDLYAPHANVYHQRDGAPWPIMRDSGHVVATLQQFAHIEEVLGPWGGQLSSFEWVFSPKSLSGAPEPMFDRATGDVDPTVAQYWHDHYDLAHIVESTWPTRGPMLRGHIHLFVGTADTFYLDQSARLFEARLQKLGADPHFTYIPDRTHFNLYFDHLATGPTDHPDRMALFDRISTEMYAVARPGKSWPNRKPTTPPTP